MIASTSATAAHGLAAKAGPCSSSASDWGVSARRSAACPREPRWRTCDDARLLHRTGLSLPRRPSPAPRVRVARSRRRSLAPKKAVGSPAATFSFTCVNQSHFCGRPAPPTGKSSRTPAATFVNTCLNQSHRCGDLRLHLGRPVAPLWRYPPPQPGDPPSSETQSRSPIQAGPRPSTFLRAGSTSSRSAPPSPA
jgi:hypothetical protein